MCNLKSFISFIIFLIVFIHFLLLSPGEVRAKQVFGDITVEHSPDPLYANTQTITFTLTSTRDVFLTNGEGYTFSIKPPNRVFGCGGAFKIVNTNDPKKLEGSVRRGCGTDQIGNWHLKVFLGTSEQLAESNGGVLITDYLFEISAAQVAGVIPQINPVKSPLGIAEKPQVRLINAKAGYWYQFWWDGNVAYGITTHHPDADGDFTYDDLSATDRQPGKKVLCMEASTYFLGLNWTPATSDCVYKAVFDFQVTPPPPGALTCTIDNPKPPEEGDSVSLKIANGPANTDIYANLDNSTSINKIGPQKSDSSGILFLMLGNNMPAGNYVASVFDTNNKSICPDVPFNVYKKGSVPTSVITKTCTSQEAAYGKCNSAAGKQCITNDPNDPAISTAIGCIHTNMAGLLSDLYKIVIALGGGFAFLMMLLGGIQMIVSQGNPQALATARGRFTSALIGLLFIIFSLLLMQIIGVDILQLPGFTK